MKPTEFGAYLRTMRERKRLSLRGAAATSGVSVTYLWQIETGKRSPSAEVLKKLAEPYGATVRELLEAAGYLEEPSPSESERERLTWAMNAILADPEYRFGTRVNVGDMNVDTMRFIVEMYEKTTGKKLLK